MNRIYKIAFMLFLLVNSGWQLNAQISFTNSNDLLMSSDWHSGVALGAVDMNDDNLVDILRLSQGSILTIEFQNLDSSFTPYTYGSIANQSQWSMAAGDVNNDGKNDVISGDYNTAKIAISNTDDLGFTHETLPGPDFFSQAANFADIDNDGYLDIFICDDNAESRIWRNNGDGTFAMADDMIDMSTTPASDDSGNYGSMWTDFDNDGDIDLYIAKCRQGVGDPTDPRRINALFVNDGNGNYTEQAEEYGLKIGYQSWTSDFNDIDNDGDLDCFITNHDFANQLLINDGKGNFEDISTGNNIGISTTTFPIQGVMRDFDNDGFVDILVAGSVHHLYRNNGDKTFTEVTGLFDNNDMESFALGDLNNDGFVDIYGGYAGIYTNPSSIDDVIWLNDANDNNWFGVDLEGTVSNRNGVGARIEIYGDWGIQIREVRAGESYGIMNSFKQNFGLGQAAAIDHVVVKWPSGIINVIDGPDINQYMSIVEAPCATAVDVEIESDGASSLCEGTTVELSAPDGYNYLWNNGATTSSITVDEAGAFSVVVQDMASGCYGISQNLCVEYEADETPIIAIDGDLAFCEGGSVTLTSSDALAYTWSGGETSQSITVSEPGEYSVMTEGSCDDYTSEATTVEVFTATLPEADDVELQVAGPATLTATGDNPQWYDAAVGGNLLAEGNTYEIPLVESTLTVWVEDKSEFASEEESTGMEQHLGSNYSGGQWNGGIVFNAMTAFKLKSVLVITNTAGERTIQLQDSDGNVLTERMVDIPATDDDGVRIDLDFDVPVGTDMVLTTDGDLNNTNFGDVSPILKRADAGVDYDSYMIENVLQMTNSNVGGMGRYYYFFDWEVEPLIFCQSERVAVDVDVVTSTYSIDNSNEVKLFPNPTSGQINLSLDFEQSVEVNVFVTDLAGKLVYKENVGTVNGQHNHSMNLANLAKGIYLVRIATEEHTYFGKVAIQ